MQTGLWCNWLALKTLNLPIRVQIPAGPKINFLRVYTNSLRTDMNALVAQWIAHWTSNPEVAGSNPVKSVSFVKSKIIRDGVVGNISACHADARGSIPRRGVLYTRTHTHTHIYFMRYFGRVVKAAAC